MNTKFIEISDRDCQNFITLAGEQIQVIKRQHPFVLIGPILGIILTSFFILIFGNLINYFVLKSTITGITFSFVASLATFALIIKSILDWYYHLYVITSRKILEIRCIPFFSDQIDDVFLDQVRTTEIDATIPNFICELLDMGDVTIAFDRPSHDEVYILSNIKNPREVAILLGKEFEDEMTQSPVWFKSNETTPLVKVSEDVYPNLAN